MTDATLWINTRVVTADGDLDRAPASGALEIETAGGRIAAGGPALPRRG